MSFFRARCPWCHVEYMTGVVGTQLMGPGHRCPANVECDTPDCTEPGTWRVVTLEGQRTLEDEAFSCTAHIGKRAILMSQGRSSEEARHE